MGTKYSTQTQSGYNSSAPPDDGSVQASNKVNWSFVKTKIGDPVLTLAQAINTALVTFTNFGSRAVSSTDSVAAADHMKTIEATSTYTESLPDAAATGAGFIVSIRNNGTGITTVALVTATDTLNGVVNGTLLLNPKCSVQLKTNAAATGYYTIAQNGIARSVAMRATADQSITTNTTLASATNLSFPIAANEEWVAEFNLFVGANLATTGIKLGFTTPTGSTLDVNIAPFMDLFSVYGYTKTATASGTTFDYTAGQCTGTAIGWYKVAVWVLNGSTAGTCQLQIAQSTSSGTALVLRKGSHMRADQLA